MLLSHNCTFLWLFSFYLKAVPHSDRQAIARVRNCVAALAQCKMMIYDTSIMHAYDASIQLEYEVNCPSSPSSSFDHSIPF